MGSGIDQATNHADQEALIREHYLREPTGSWDQSTKALALRGSQRLATKVSSDCGR
jgi:hypothetical protein